ncbi:bifunctional phosphoglucose/phosphomannose isomerase [bacterium I07]|nr:bifunctional phosphoglucose/phosphomannose isomerase [bacterium I07]
MNLKMNGRDPSGILNKTRELPDQLLKGWSIGKAMNPDIDIETYRQIVFCGMGGSAIIGDLARLILSDLSLPFLVNRGYDLPSFAGPETLIVASSYSGNTEETLSCFEQAVQKKCAVICITSGGTLQKRAAELDYPVFQLPAGYPPRTASGFGLGVLLSIFESQGSETVNEVSLNESVRFLKGLDSVWSNPENPECLPYQIASKVQGRIPLIYATEDKCQAVGYRWKTQLNENSKSQAFYVSFPEMNHNEIVGWMRHEGIESYYCQLLMIILKLPDDHFRNQMRMDLTQKLVKADGGLVIELKAEGATFLARLLYLLFLGDLMSVYLSYMYKVDPADIQHIDNLKAGLAAVK